MDKKILNENSIFTENVHREKVQTDKKFVTKKKRNYF